MSISQNTYVPDDNFENYLEANGMGDGIALNDSVITANINTLTYLQIDNENISDLTGIEDFISMVCLWCMSNQLTSLDVSGLPNLMCLHVDSNQLTSLDIRNGNNQILLQADFTAFGNPNLYCINVSDTAHANAEWLWPLAVDSWAYFSNNCGGTLSVEEHSTNKELIKVIDLLGRETKGKKNEPLFYIYDDGTVEKRIVIE